MAHQFITSRANDVSVFTMTFIIQTFLKTDVQVVLSFSQVKTMVTFGFTKCNSLAKIFVFSILATDVRGVVMFAQV